MAQKRCCKAGQRLLCHICCHLLKAIPHNSKCRYGERGTADAKLKAQIILDAAKVSAASGGNSEPKQGQRSQSARGFCPRSTMRVPQPDIIEHFGNADAVPQPPERCLSRQAGIVRCCLCFVSVFIAVTLSLSSASAGKGKYQTGRGKRRRGRYPGWAYVPSDNPAGKLWWDRRTGHRHSTTYNNPR